MRATSVLASMLAAVAPSKAREGVAKASPGGRILRNDRGGDPAPSS